MNPLYRTAMAAPIPRICPDCESTPACRKSGCLLVPSVSTTAHERAAEKFFDPSADIDIAQQEDELTCTNVLALVVVLGLGAMVALGLLFTAAYFVWLFYFS